MVGGFDSRAFRGAAVVDPLVSREIPSSSGRATVSLCVCPPPVRKAPLPRPPNQNQDDLSQRSEHRSKNLRGDISGNFIGSVRQDFSSSETSLLSFPLPTLRVDFPILPFPLPGPDSPQHRTASKQRESHGGGKGQRVSATTPFGDSPLIKRNPTTPLSFQAIGYWSGPCIPPLSWHTPASVGVVVCKRGRRTGQDRTKPSNRAAKD